jgi:hypothetical protein
LIAIAGDTTFQARSLIVAQGAAKGVRGGLITPETALITLFRPVTLSRNR